MDYLGLTNGFLRETGVDDQLQTLADPSDDTAQAMHWIQSAWATWQRNRLWPFRKAEGSLTVTNGKTSYEYNSDMSLDEGDIIVPDSWYSADGGIEQISYEALRELRRSGAAADTTRVRCVALKHGDFATGVTLETYPDIGSTQSIEWDYWHGIQTLTEGGDIPYGLPADYHMGIVHLAVVKYGISAGGDEGILLRNHHGAEFKQILKEYTDFAGIDSGEVASMGGSLI